MFVFVIRSPPPRNFSFLDGVKVGVGLASGNGTVFWYSFSQLKSLFQANHSNNYNDSSTNVYGFGSFRGCCLLSLSLSLSLVLRYRQVGKDCGVKATKGFKKTKQH